jgi:hypothetical protein
MQTGTVFLLGMVGALAPEIVRLYSIRSDPSQFTWSAFYIVVSILFACLGGICALVLPATTAWGALYAGISTPVLINTALKTPMKLSGASRPKSVAPTRYGYFRSFTEAL